MEMWSWTGIFLENFMGMEINAPSDTSHFQCRAENYRLVLTNSLNLNASINPPSSGQADAAA